MKMKTRMKMMMMMKTKMKKKMLNHSSFMEFQQWMRKLIGLLHPSIRTPLRKGLNTLRSMRLFGTNTQKMKLSLS